ncbi:hypothetical protein SCG7109_AH_00280 [Chlamydiales bacterium SCGC AG-110-M15]|nr:hypothetical protein SCG7109_AH_00280 [Chlamydiales bacterium SCGC AG-110-M15]
MANSFFRRVFSLALVFSVLFSSGYLLANDQVDDLNRNENLDSDRVEIASEALLAQAGGGNSASSNLAKKYFKEGKAFFDKGDFENALESFRKSLYEDPTDPVLNHLMGRSAYELGNYEEALFAFERVLVLNPNLVLSRLEKARTHMALGSRVEARQEFNRVLESDIPSDVRKNVEALLAQLGSGREHTFGGILLLSNSWNSNVTLGTGELPSPFIPSFISNPTLRSDRIFSSALVLTHQYPLAHEGLTWKNNATGYISDNSTVNENDLNLGIFSTGLEKVYQRHTFGGFANWTGILLQGDSYQSNYTGALTYKYAYSPRVSWRFGWNYTRRHHFAVSGTTQTLGFVHVYTGGMSFRQDEKNTWDISWTHKFDKSPREGNEGNAYNRYDIVTKYTRVLNPRVNFNLSFTRRHDEYTSSLLTTPVDPGTNVRPQRSDLMLSGTGGFTIKLTPKVFFDISGTYTDNNSNIDVSTYMIRQLAMTLTAIY